MLEIKYIEINSLPCLAWLAEKKKDSNTVNVYCGGKVEQCDEFFVAGVWDADFEKGGFSDSEVFYGSGARLTENGIEFVTASHALERLVMHEKNGNICVSNSVPFLMAHCNLALDEKINQYEKYFCSIIYGYEKFDEKIPLKNGEFLSQYFVGSITVSESGIYGFSKRKRVEDFTSFDNYYSRMMNSMTRIKENAESPARKKKSYGFVSTISSGYDSSTCSLIAKKLGCETVVTLSNGRYDKDSGEEAARYIGYDSVIKRDCNSYKAQKGCIEAQYICSGEQCTHLQFIVFEDIFADNIVFMGLRGSYWDKSSTMTDDFEMGGYFFYETDTSYTENALKNGYIIIPLPTYGSSNYTSIRKITNSDEMKKWTLGGSYDKPIPRRILEENGVPRGTFGKTKYGGGFSFCFDNMKTLAGKMSQEGYNSFREWRKKHRVKFSLNRFGKRFIYFTEILPIAINKLASVIHIKSGLKMKPLTTVNPDAPSDMIFWGTEKMIKYYSDIIK